MIRSVRVLCAAGLAAAVISCAPQAVGVSGPAAVSPGAAGNTGSPSLVTDAARGQVVFVDTNGTRVDIVSQEPDGSTVASTEAVGMAVMPGSEGAPASRGISQGGGGEQLRAIVVGGRPDGRGGIWAVLSNGLVLPAGESLGGGNGSGLPDCDDAGHNLRASMGWTYTVTGVSPDGRLVIGNAVNKNGFQRGGITIDPGTTVGVFWKVARISHRPYVSVDSARVIGTLDLSSLPAGHHGWKQRLTSLLVSILSHLKLFFLNYFSAYLTSADAVTFDSSTGLYSVTGTDQDGNDAVATIDSRNTITITPVATGPTQADVTAAIQAITGAFTQAEAQGPVGSAAAFAWAYTSPAGGSATLTLQGVLIAATGVGTWGTMTFSNYSDTASGNTINGTLQVQVYQPGVSPSNLTPVQWAGFRGLVDVTGTLAFSGTLPGNVGVDFLDTQSGTTMGLSGTVSLGGSYFDAASGAVVATPVASVSISPASSNEYTPSAISPLTMTSAGSTAIYYTLNGLTPSTGSTLYSGPITGGGVTDFVVEAIAVSGASTSRVSLKVYPGVGGS